MNEKPIAVMSGTSRGWLRSGLYAIRSMPTLSSDVQISRRERVIAKARFASSAALFDLAFARFADREARDEAVTTLDGRMVEAPVVERARRILALASGRQTRG